MHLRIAVITALLSLAALCAFGQTPTPDGPNTLLPTYVSAGVAFNQSGTPKANIFASAIYPVTSGVYTSTTADIIPIRLMTAAGKPYYSLQPTVRQGVHKVVYTRAAFTALIGADAGAAFSQASPSGMNVNLATSVTATGIWRIGNSFGVVVPIRGLRTPQSGWNLVPQIGILFKP